MKTFYDKFMNGEIEFDSIHDEIAVWHNGNNSPESPLSEYLGLTWAEYTILVENEEKFAIYLKYVRDSKRNE